jgi:two-component sensor histidine kinase
MQDHERPSASALAGFFGAHPLPDAPQLHRQIFEQVSSGVVIYRAVDDGDDFLIVDVNPAVEKIEQVSWKDVAGRRVTEVFPGVTDFGLLDVFRRVWRSGTLEHHPLGRYLDARITGWRDNRVFRLPGGDVVAVYDDRTREVEAEEAKAHQALLAAEMNHRVKNLLASIDATMRSTLRGASSLEDFGEVFSGRLDAFSRGSDLLRRTDWGSVALGEVLRTALGAFGAAEVSVPQELVLLPGKAALGMNLIVHELATNASKYGALSTSAGIVRMDCRLSEEQPGFVVCRWIEENGPRIDPPGHKGFGSRLIERTARHDLGGQVSTTYAPAGVECVISFPVEMTEAP